MRERENLDKAISFDQKGASMYSLQMSRHASTKWPTMAMQLYKNLEEQTGTL
jgi:hypothetical protein